MSLPLLVSEAKTKIAAREKAREVVEQLEAELAAIAAEQHGVGDALDAAKVAWEEALASGGDSAKARDTLRDVNDRSEELDAREAGLRRRLGPAETDYHSKRSAAAAIVVRIATLRCAEQAEETRRLARLCGESHAKWHRLAGGAAAIATEASGHVSEPISHADPGAATLAGSRDRFDLGLEADFAAAGLVGAGGLWWQPGAGLTPASEAEILAEQKK